MKNGEMKQSKKLLEDIAWIAGNCLTVCPSQEGKGTGGILDTWSHHRGILRQCPQESPLANCQILIDGQVLIRLMAGSMTNRRVQVVDGDAHVSVYGDILIQEGQRILLKCVAVQSDAQVQSVQEHQGCVKSLSSSDVWMAGPVLSNSGCCTLFKGFDSRLNAHEWNRKAKEEINLQKDVQVSVQALEQLGSQLKTLDEGDENSEWQWDCHIPFSFKKIMKGLQALLKVELREVRRDERRQGNAEDELVCSKQQEGSAQRKGYELGPNRWSFVTFGQAHQTCSMFGWLVQVTRG
ncbi:hypothetical protein DY000_02049007 [Brassica cretica]|uniref:Uncharacterized protein n=1 Tax=Brassica cretica TaxID=69181 RepID=A0ABQ7F3G9_BRACR|nr:hypothetical protein DY000_02049007 [Brassica cretica]